MNRWTLMIIVCILTMDSSLAFSEKKTDVKRSHEEITMRAYAKLLKVHSKPLFEKQFEFAERLKKNDFTPEEYKRIVLNLNNVKYRLNKQYEVFKFLPKRIKRAVPQVEKLANKSASEKEFYERNSKKIEILNLDPSYKGSPANVAINYPPPLKRKDGIFAMLPPTFVSMGNSTGEEIRPLPSSDRYRLKAKGPYFSSRKKDSEDMAQVARAPASSTPEENAIEESGQYDKGKSQRLAEGFSARELQDMVVASKALKEKSERSVMKESEDESDLNTGEIHGHNKDLFKIISAKYLVKYDQLF